VQSADIALHVTGVTPDKAQTLYPALIRLKAILAHQNRSLIDSGKYSSAFSGINSTKGDFRKRKSQSH
jgi:hypothetical protein